MDTLTERVIDDAIAAVMRRLSTSSNIRELYPNQHMMLHKFLERKDILYTVK